MFWGWEKPKVLSFHKNKSFVGKTVFRKISFAKLALRILALCKISIAQN